MKVHKEVFGPFHLDPVTEVPDRSSWWRRWFMDRADTVMRVSIEDAWYIDWADQKWVAPVGTLTDGFSIPWFIRPITGGKYQGSLKAAVMHDAYYKKHRGAERHEVDLMFYQAMLDDNKPKWKAGAFYYAVRTFGWFAWNQGEE